MFLTLLPLRLLRVTITLSSKVVDLTFREHQVVIEFGDSYEAPQEVADTSSASEGSAKKKGRTIAVTTEDMQKRRNDVKARTTRLLALPDEHQLRFSNGKEEVNTASFSTASTQVSPTSADVVTASFSHDTVCAYIASQSNGSHVKYKDINQIDEDDIKEMNIKWNMALLRSEGNPGAKTGVEEKSINKVRGLEFKVESKDNRIKRLTKELDELKKEKEGLDRKLTGFQSASKDLDTLLGSRRPSLSIESNSSDLQNSDSSVSEKGDSSGMWDEQGKTWPKNNNTHKSMSPINVFHKTGRTPMRTNRPNMNTAQPKRTSFTKPTHSYVRRPFQRTSAVRAQFRVPRVSTINTKFPTINKNFPTGNSKLSTADVGDKGKAVKASGNSHNVIDDK
nr:hypothetical protein [Tanacetum cinerariifolium]